MGLKIYLARAMTGRVKAEVLAEALHDNHLVEGWGAIPLDPVTQEGIEAVPDIISAPETQLRQFWKRDKEMIREAHIVFDMSPKMKSEGVAHEVGYARYFLWKPVIRVYPSRDEIPAVSVAREEDDYLASSLIDALQYATMHYDTQRQRIIWRWKLLKRCLWKFLVYQLGEWK